MLRPHDDCIPFVAYPVRWLNDPDRSQNRAGWYRVPVYLYLLILNGRDLILVRMFNGYKQRNSFRCFFMIPLRVRGGLPGIPGG